jgi:hypothetical protein
MARHKKIQAPEEDEPGLDISSLIDVCFLLLIYFFGNYSDHQEGAGAEYCAPFHDSLGDSSGSCANADPSRSEWKYFD